MIKVGTMVRYKDDGAIGIVTEINQGMACLLYWVRWGDGTESDHLDFELEVIA